MAMSFVTRVRNTTAADRCQSINVSGAIQNGERGVRFCIAAVRGAHRRPDFHCARVIVRSMSPPRQGTRFAKLWGEAFDLADSPNT